MSSLYHVNEYDKFLAVLDAEIRQRQAVIVQINQFLSAAKPSASATVRAPKAIRAVRRGRKPLSKAARARISEAQRKRWAVQKKIAKAAEKK